MTQTSDPHLSPDAPDAPDVVAPAPARSPGRSAVDGALAHGLPPQAYVGEAHFALENEKLFANAWVFAGFAHELSATGDVVPVTVAGQPLMLLRGRDGGIRAFHNVCRHRCAILVDAPGNVGRVITCPYHAWAYGLDGSLRTTPHFAGPDRHDHPGLDRRQMGLKPVRSGVWQDWVFVNLSGTAAAFEDFIAPIARRLEDLNLAQMRPVATIDMGEVRTNWKFLMENYHRALSRCSSCTRRRPSSRSATIPPSSTGTAWAAPSRYRRRKMATAMMAAAMVAATVRAAEIPWRSIPGTSRCFPISCWAATIRIRLACT